VTRIASLLPSTTEIGCALMAEMLPPDIFGTPHRGAAWELLD
jgi:hypothetical protein